MLSYYFFKSPATSETYTLSLHDALPILDESSAPVALAPLPTLTPKQAAFCDAYAFCRNANQAYRETHEDRKSTRLNSSHSSISYAVFCLKKKINLSNLVLSYTSPHQTPY